MSSKAMHVFHLWVVHFFVILYIYFLFISNSYNAVKNEKKKKTHTHTIFERKRNILNTVEH